MASSAGSRQGRAAVRAGLCHGAVLDPPSAAAGGQDTLARYSSPVAAAVRLVPLALPAGLGPSVAAGQPHAAGASAGHRGTLRRLERVLRAIPRQEVHVLQLCRLPTARRHAGTGPDEQGRILAEVDRPSAGREDPGTRLRLGKHAASHSPGYGRPGEPARLHALAAAGRIRAAEPRLSCGIEKLHHLRLSAAGFRQGLFHRRHGSMFVMPTSIHC